MVVKPNIAVIGCGYWGPNLIRNFASLRDICRISKVCDRSPERLAYIENLYSEIRGVARLEEIIDDPSIEAVAIATPVCTHREIAMRCLRAGKHVMIEKPLAASTQEAVELCEAASQRGLTLMVGHTFIYTTAVRYIKQAIAEGKLGEILYISASRLNLGLFQNDINVAWDLAPHDISIILYLLEETPEQVNCLGKCHLNGREDVTTMSLTFPGGGFATIQSSWLDPNKVRKMTIVGSEAMLIYDDTEPLEKIRIYDKRVTVPPHYDTYAEFHFSYHYGDLHVPYLQQTEPLRVECRHFIESFTTGQRPETSGVEGLHVVQILEAASESIRRGGAAVRLTEQVPLLQTGAAHT